MNYNEIKQVSYVV